MQQEAGAAEMCTYAHHHMVVFVREAGKIYSPCKCGSETICDNMRGALHTFNNFNSSVVNQYTSPSNTVLRGQTG